MHRTLSAAGAFWLAAFTYFIWGFTFLASRIAQDYAPFVLLFWRFALAFLLLNLLRLTRRFPVRFRSRKLWPVLLAGLFEPVLYFPCEQYGLKLTSTSFSGVMVALIPLCSLVYGAVFLHEKATWRQVVFSVLSVAGVIVLAVYATGIGAGSFLGFLILLGTVFAGAGYIVACRACSGSFDLLSARTSPAAWAPPRSGCCPCSSTGTTWCRRAADDARAVRARHRVFERGGFGAVLPRAQPGAGGCCRRAHRSAHQLPRPSCPCSPECSSCTSRSAGSAPWPRPPSSSASGACSASLRRQCRTLTSAPSRCPRREQAGRLPHFQSSMLLHYLSSENC